MPNTATPEHLNDLAVSDTGFVFDPYTGLTYSLNGTGLALLRGMKEGLDRDGLVARLREGFEVSDGVDLRRDLDEFVHLLRVHGLVPKAYEP